MRFPLGYHITWGTHGGRLHGSARPYVDRDHNEYGAPFPPTDPQRENAARDRMREAPVTLSPEERLAVEQFIRELAQRYNWVIHAIAVQSDHVHVVVSAPREGEALRDALKATASRGLNKLFGVQTWWAENGSAKYIWTASYLKSASKYVMDQCDV
jgi:REP element-mobilizing transposase RayT